MLTLTLLTKQEEENKDFHEFDGPPISINHAVRHLEVIKAQPQMLLPDIIGSFFLK